MGEVDLLFFDTFAHENSEELNLDLVQFPKPVYVTEVRIIPLGARVQADFPGGVRLGATNPSQFSIEFFVNDLGKPGASTFESLGGFDYNQNGCINLECVPNDSIRKIPTDGLVLRGWYTTITLAVYGILTVNVPEQIIQPVVSPAIPPQSNALPELQQIIPVTPLKSEWPQDNIQAVPIEYTQQPAVSYPPSYGTAEQQYSQEYSEYYSEIPKDPRSFHNTPETDWDNKNRVPPIDTEHKADVDRYQKTGSLEREHCRLDIDRRDRDRHYVRSHSQDRDRSRDYRESSRERDRDWEFERNKNFDYRDHKDVEWDRDRPYKHPDAHRRTYSRDDREDARKRPRTPPSSSPKRPHTPHTNLSELSPKEIETFPESDKVKKEWENQNANRGHSEKPSGENAFAQSPPIEEAPHANVEEFEPILSDEDILDDSEHYQDIDYDYTAYTNNDDIIKLFIPGTTTLKKYEKDPIYKVSSNGLEIDNNLKSTINIADDFFKSSITKYTLAEFENLNVDIKEEFIHICEKITSTIGEDKTFCNITALYVAVKNLSYEDFDESSKDIIVQTKFVIGTMLEWIKIALDYHMANTQNLPAYKIRHIKCGVRLADWCCNSIDFIQLLWDQNYDIANMLLYLYNREYMALSIKLMILHALDTYLLHKHAIEHFISAKESIELDVKENGVLNSEESGYKKLIEIVMKNPLVRVKFALLSILKKLNLFESLYKLQDTISKIRHDVTRTDVDISSIIKLLNQILELYRKGPLEISQPKRFLPAAAQFDINRSGMKNLFLQLFDIQNLLNSCMLLLTLPNTMNLSTIKTPILELLASFLHTMEGVQYLYNNCECVNTLLKILLQSEEIIQYSMPYSVEIEGHILGLRIAYALQCQYHIDYLLDNAQSHKFDCDASNLIDHLHGIYCLTFSSVGKITCSQILGFDQNIQCLLQFFELLHVKEKSEQQLSKIKKSPGYAYIIDLIAFAIIYNSNVTFLEKNAKQFLHIMNQQELFDDSVILKINEIVSYVKPFETINMVNYDNIAPIVDMIIKHLDNVTTYPGQLITCLRILDHLGISKHTCKSPTITEGSLNNYVELKYKHVILQLYSLDGLTMLTNILQKVCKFYEQPSIHLATFVSNQSINIINVIKPCIDLLKQMLTYVIQCRNTNYKDLTAVPVLLQSYNLLRTFPSNSPVYFMARKLCEKIIDTLLVYTQPVSEEINENDLLNKTLWTQMCVEVIKYVNLAPYTFISGLLIFSELLPLPLPLQTRELLTSEEVSWAVNLRKLWAAHLHIYSSNIQELINRMCTSTHPPLLNLLRKVCIQLADLAANSAIMIAKGILDTVEAGLTTEGDVLMQPCSGNVARLLNFLACLVTHNSLKCAILNLIQNGNSINKTDDKYSFIIPSFGKILNYNSNVNSHVQAQECILSIIQSLCDTEITLLQSDGIEKNEITSEVYLADSLPVKDTLLSFISMMVDHLMSDNTFVTYLPIIRTLLLLMEHDYGFYHLRDYLLKRTMF
ncbi:hypothetical protein RI129_008724 [Pyrocoelia pectoralis]|uniref:Virilizer N-terminal domain-containing protein n=1 Tax=Pyrocoelia pectoralis TaxID=417401 RepID=A0AAN7ZG97_9COLE